MILLKELERKQERDQKRVKETHVLALLVHTITTLLEEEILQREAEAILTLQEVEAITTIAVVHVQIVATTTAAAHVQTTEVLTEVIAVAVVTLLQQEVEAIAAQEAKAQVEVAAEEGAVSN
jgi:hypothetical protein